MQTHADQGSTLLRLVRPSQRRSFILFPNRRMKQGYNLVYSTVHGNACGVIIEPRTSEDLPEEDRKNYWIVRIGVLVAEAALSADYPKADFDDVSDDLKDYCTRAGVMPAA
ncbi:MAG: hypothetical protein ACR2FY_23775 [Pirellulaceae bacterium]